MTLVYLSRLQAGLETKIFGVELFETRVSIQHFKTSRVMENTIIAIPVVFVCQWKVMCNLKDLPDPIFSVERLFPCDNRAPIPVTNSITELCNPGSTGHRYCTLSQGSFLTAMEPITSGISSLTIELWTKPTYHSSQFSNFRVGADGYPSEPWCRFRLAGNNRDQR